MEGVIIRMLQSNRVVKTLAAEIRSRPIRVLAIDSQGEEHIVSVAECYARRYKYLHIVADDVDTLLDQFLNAKR